MNPNRVVIYSNGIADFQRAYDVSPETPSRISIPVRQDHLADVLASFNIYGPVKLERPPTFHPSNEMKGNISINPSGVFEDLCTKLSGARIRIERAGGAIEGMLVGLHQEEEATAGEPVDAKSVIVQATDGLCRCSFREIQRFRFLDEDVQTEIDKALQRNYQKIKPNSTFVELELSCREKAATAVVQYTLPAAAWKISYRLRLAEKDTAEFQGFAIVDNNTDEDWNDFQVCVVTGEPITFSTDLAETKSPRRQHVRLVSDSALGAVEVDEGMMMAAEAAGGAQVSPLKFSPGMMKMRAMRERERLSEDSAEAFYDEAPEMSSAEVYEVGDFSVFESEATVTIPAQRSAVIPVFKHSLSDIRQSLHYKHENHPTRPFRSIDFTNRTEFSLGRGVCTVFDQGTFVGNCLMPALKPGEQRLLPHALETGVTVKREQKWIREKLVSLEIGDGVCYTSRKRRQAVHYHIRNDRDSQYRLIIDHDHLMSEPEVTATLIGNGTETQLQPLERLSSGLRYELDLPAKSEFQFVVNEQKIDRTRVTLVTSKKIDIDWLKLNLVESNGPLSEHPEIQQCLRIQEDIEAKKHEIKEAIEKSEQLIARQQRLRENIKAGGQDELTHRWRNELDEAEQKLREIEEIQVPALRADEQEIQNRLREAFRLLTAEWSADS